MLVEPSALWLLAGHALHAPMSIWLGSALYVEAAHGMALPAEHLRQVSRIHQGARVDV